MSLQELHNAYKPTYTKLCTSCIYMYISCVIVSTYKTIFYGSLSLLFATGNFEFKSTFGHSFYM